MSEEEKSETHEERKEEKTITIRKDDLWKYSTFVLIAVVVIGALVMLSGGDGNANTGTGAAVNVGAGAAVDISPFLSNSQLYPSLGPADSKNVVIEFSDFQCPWCAIASGLPQFAKDAAKTNSNVASVLGLAKEVKEMAADGKLKFIYVPWSFQGPESDYAAEAALCANDQGKFWEMHDAIFTTHDGSENNGKYDKDKLEIIAAGISGIDTANFNSCLEDGDYTSSLQRISSDVRGAGITGTPTFFVNGQKVSSSLASIQAALK
ncbi:MAG: thioredoxin domain-containing protein [Nanoarchaeota archaeon]|nr:thioredoxin domain-containing protein [Nanoarchaeota archaeon]